MPGKFPYKRDGNGKFAKGTPSRHAGPALTERTHLSTIRNSILASWNKCNGAKLLEELAKADPLSYLKLVASILPKVIEPAAPLVDEREQTDTASGFLDGIRRKVGRRDVTHAEVLAALEDEAFDTGRGNGRRSRR